MNVMTFHKRMIGSSNRELRQAYTRLSWVLLLIADRWLFGDMQHSSLEANEGTVLTGLAGWLTVAIVIFAATMIWPAPNPVRRVLGMLGDIAGITFFLYFAGQSGAAFAGLYLLFILGNGSQYGGWYLYTSVVISAVVFQFVAAEAPWWRDQWSVVSGWIFVMFLVPMLAPSFAPPTSAVRDPMRETPEAPGEVRLVQD